ncbi:hypothetical protein MO973_30945 [Paenibacillus sp. TRM 82003]|nr:hypothetical protein [Paenibacillus sp. TRM 82003]
MHFFNSGLYREVWNGDWMMVIVMWFVFALSFLAPTIIWGLLNGKRPFQRLREKASLKRKRAGN